MRSGRSLSFLSLFCGLFLVAAVPAKADLPAAKAALRSGNFPEAIDQAARIEATHPYDAAMITARSEMEMGRYAPALAAARQAQSARPGDSAAFALEGLILLRMGRPVQAMVVLRRALDLAATPQQKEIARALLRQARAARTWQFTGGVGLTPSTNLNKATTAETITVLLPGTDITTRATLSGGQAKSGTGLRLFGSARRNLGGHIGLSFGADLTHTDDPGLRQQAGQVGLSWSKGASRIDLSYQHRFVGGTDYAATTTLGLGHNLASSPNSVLKLGARVSDRRRFDDPLRGSRTSGASLRYSQAVNSGRVWDMGINLSHTTSASAFEAADQATLDFGVRQAVPRTGWVVDGRVSFGFGQWDRIAPFEPEIRQDHSTTVTFSAQNNAISLYGLTPTYGVAFHRRSSNLARHDIRSTDVFLGLANAF